MDEHPIATAIRALGTIIASIGVLGLLGSFLPPIASQEGLILQFLLGIGVLLLLSLFAYIAISVRRVAFRTVLTNRLSFWSVYFVGGGMVFAFSGTPVSDFLVGGIAGALIVEFLWYLRWTPWNSIPDRTYTTEMEDCNGV